MEMKMNAKKIVLGSLAVAALGALTLGAVNADSRGAGPMGGPMGGMAERPSFEELDTDGDGNITIAEMRARAAARFGEADTNGDGKLTSEELVAAAAAQAAERAATAMARMIQWRDVDGDGMLSLGEMAGDAGPMIFMRLDGNDDGMISAEEFSSMQDRMEDRMQGQMQGQGRMQGQMHGDGQMQGRMGDGDCHGGGDRDGHGMQGSGHGWFGNRG
jgi:Ca2+-binding EF-hand superfamily protein